MLSKKLESETGFSPSRLDSLSFCTESIIRAGSEGDQLVHLLHIQFSTIRHSPTTMCRVQYACM